jgi:FXSXX-COOH protein
MGRRGMRAAAAVSGAVLAAMTSGGVASADTGVVESELADVSTVSLSAVRTDETTVLANSIARALAETGSGNGTFALFQSAPPR